MATSRNVLIFGSTGAIGTACANYFVESGWNLTTMDRSLTELENMLPWEREIYVTMLVQHIEEENEKIKQQNATKR